MKHIKEIRVALIAIIALFLLYFGFNFLKGINVFHKANNYVATFSEMNGLVEQAPVYVKGYKIGIVDHIYYDFTQEEPFTVVFSTNQDIILPAGTQVALVADGLISGEALELRIPAGDPVCFYQVGDTIPSAIEPGMIAGITSALMNKLNPMLANLDSIIYVLEKNLSDERVNGIVDNVDGTMANARAITGKLNNMVGKDVPMLMDSVRTVLSDVHTVTANLAGVDFQATILKVDTAIDGVNQFVNKVNSTDGTVGMLLNDKDLYVNLNNTISSADSLVVDLKAHPKRYVHFSLFGKKDK